MFHHCSKAFRRSALWEPASWTPDVVASRAHIAHAIERPEDSWEEIREYYEGPGYEAGMYRNP